MELFKDSEVPTAHMVFNPRAIEAAAIRGLGIAVPGAPRGFSGLSSPGGLASIIGGGATCEKLPTNWDAYCDCVWNKDDPGGGGDDNATCKSRPNLTAWLFAPWTKVGAQARAAGAPTQASADRWAASTGREGNKEYFAAGGLHEQRGGTPTRLFDTFAPLVSVNKLALAGAGVLVAGAVAALVLGRKPRGAVNGYGRRSRRRRPRR